MAIEHIQSEGVALGYRVSGDGPHTILSIPGAVSNLALEKHFPPVVEWYDFLGRLGRLVNFDKRGNGESR